MDKWADRQTERQRDRQKDRTHKHFMRDPTGFKFAVSHLGNQTMWHQSDVPQKQPATL